MSILLPIKIALFNKFGIPLWAWSDLVKDTASFTAQSSDLWIPLRCLTALTSNHTQTLMLKMTQIGETDAGRQMWRFVGRRRDDVPSPNETRLTRYEHAWARISKIVDVYS